MNLQTRCRRCGRRFGLDRTAILGGRWPLCPRCRGPLPPTGGVPVRDGIRLLVRVPEAAA